MAPSSHPESNRPEAVDELLRSFAREGWRGGALRAQLADRFPDRPPDDIEDAVQGACADFLAEGAGVTEPRAVYAWIRTAAHHALLHELRRRRRAVPVDPGEGPLAEATAGGRGPVEELIALEDDSALEVLVGEVASSLSEGRREILALWAAGRRRAEIAAELGIGERVVKRSLEEILREARAALEKRAGGGCEEGGSIVMRLVCGLAPAGEAARARAHLDSCGRCSAFAASLEAWREKAGAILPLPVAPAVEVVSSGLLGRAAGRAGEALDSARRHLLGGGAHIGGRAAAGVGTTGDPTPLAGVRPGAVAAVVAGCLAVGGGATYCARQGVDPLGVAGGLIAGSEEPAAERPERQPPEPEEPVTPTYEPAPEEAPTYEPEEEEGSAPPATEGQSEPSPEPKVSSEPEPVAEEVTPPPEQSFEPASPDYPATEATVAAPEPTTTKSSPSEEAKPVPANEAPQFGGP